MTPIPKVTTTLKIYAAKFQYRKEEEDLVDVVMVVEQSDAGMLFTLQEMKRKGK